MATRPAVVGRFRSGHQIDGQPSSLDEWRVTTGDPDVAAAIYAELGGDAPAEWEAKGEDNLEVFNASKSVDILLESESAIRQRLVLWGRNSSPNTTVGELEYTGTGLTPDVEIYFRLASQPDLGIFKFQTSSWSLVADLNLAEAEARLVALLAVSDSAKAGAKLEIVKDSFVAMRGSRKGSLVEYNKPALTLTGDE